MTKFHDDIEDTLPAHYKKELTCQTPKPYAHWRASAREVAGIYFYVALGVYYAASRTQDKCKRYRPTEQRTTGRALENDSSAPEEMRSARWETRPAPIL